MHNRPCGSCWWKKVATHTFCVSSLTPFGVQEHGVLGFCSGSCGAVPALMNFLKNAPHPLVGADSLPLIHFNSNLLRNNGAY